ncbi:alpha-N-acetylglucosaminidase [Ginsengibacter hankyongi]|uniref:Alpha-N-acetylglucosaminidase n=1 Tax=Ginsengibacter hankyongi TaxID=2607284 RepID=A0A5J5IC83_9BACT|nr:alpha-N-acetylglucosaminidase [Ginsengibacter hankyongi]KAA9036075.1 alpha-N-acetylglucosaminidase [Ginsengibacter hankyongi]
MRYIIKNSVILIVLLFAFCKSNAGDRAKKQPDKNDTELSNVYSLAKRVLENRSNDFVFQLEKKANGKDFFEISKIGKKILIKGNNGVSLASGLNWYLKKYCNSQFTVIDQHIALPAILTQPLSPEVMYTKFNKRYFFNVCTFSYTMAWWDWKDWERQIDWMAMNGINFPLAITGQEAVWTEVYKALGLSQKQIDNFLVGPAYLPWSWMGNIDGLGGPLPKSWIEKHKVLEQKILKRERDLGMTPILQAFTGHVPESIKEIYPNAKLHQTGNWSAGFGGTYFLDPSDTLFQRIGKLFIQKQTEMYGTDHYYSADCFNEVNPDSNDPGFLSNMSRSVYKSMATADPKAVWVMQAWFLYYSIDNFWREPQVKALLGAVPNDKMIILDLWGEVHPVWKKQSAFYGKPWIWNVLQNFGGRTSMSGRLQDMATNLKDVLSSPDKGNFSGIGMAMEYFGNDPVVQEFVMNMVWEKDVPDVKQWIGNYVADRYGKKNEFARKAWQGMLETVYNSNKQTGTFLCERPGFYNSKLAYRTSPIPDYDNKILGEALDNLLKCSNQFKNLDTYQFDVVNLTRQYLSPLGYYWILQLKDAYDRRDLDRFLKIKAQFIELIKDFDVLLSTRKEYLLGRWISTAKKWGDTRSEKDLYEWNARNIITLWGEKCTEGQFDDLNNYAYKQWAGMFTSYHLVQWNKFFDEVETALKKNENWDRAPFLDSSCQWEKNWSSQKNIFPTKPQGDPIEVSKRMYQKYLSFIVKYSK